MKRDIYIQIINSKSDFFKTCLRELDREGIKVGDVIQGTYDEEVNKTAVDFKSPKTGVDCVAWLGDNCKELSVYDYFNLLEIKMLESCHVLDVSINNNTHNGHNCPNYQQN